MKHATYMSKNELLEFLKIGAFCAELMVMVEHTTDKVWRRKMKTMVTFCDSILKERLLCLEKKQLDSVARRKNHTKLMLCSVDPRRIDDNASDYDGEVIISMKDLLAISDQSLSACKMCKQGDKCQTCKLREVYHRVGIIPLRTEVGEGQCEFRSDDKVGKFKECVGLADSGI